MGRELRTEHSFFVSSKTEKMRVILLATHRLKRINQSVEFHGYIPCESEIIARPCILAGHIT